MRVTELTAWQVRIPLQKPIQHASHTRTDTDNVVVRCVLADGTAGYGEGVPREYVTGETIDSALRLLQTSDLPAQLDACRDFDAAIGLAGRLRLAPIPGDERGCMGNGGRCAVELALLDAFGKHFCEPLATVTKRLFPELYEPKTQVRYSGAITSAQGRKARFAAWKMRLYGFRQLKIKVGIAGQDDVDRVGAIRRRVGKGMDLRIDANEAWTPANVAARIMELKPFGITSIEQPVPHDQIGVMAEVRPQVGVPIMLDESLCGLVDAERAVAQKTCDLFNLRLSKCGGFLATLKLAQFARRHGLGYQLGCQIGETAILSAAGRHFAASVRDLRYVEGSYDRHLVREALGTRDLTFGYGGVAPALAGPGLGVAIDPAALARVAVRKEVLLADLPAGLAVEEHQASDGYRWKYRRYSAPESPRGAVVFLHGIQSHAGWYEHSCRVLSQAGYTIYFLDRRGAGLNAEGRGDAPGFRRLLDDIAEFLTALPRTVPRGHRVGRLPVFLAGISWGGKLAVALERRHPGLIDGLLLLCPGFFAKVRPPLGQRLKIFLARLFRPSKRFPVPLNDPELFTANPRWQQFLRDDPLRLHQATARLMIESVRLDGYLRFVPKYVHVPVLLLLAEHDRIIRNDRTRTYVARFATPDREVIEYPGAHHTLEFEPDPTKFLADVQGWLDRHAETKDN